MPVGAVREPLLQILSIFNMDTFRYPGHNTFIRREYDDKLHGCHFNSGFFSSLTTASVFPVICMNDACNG